MLENSAVLPLMAQGVSHSQQVGCNCTGQRNLAHSQAGRAVIHCEELQWSEAWLCFMHRSVPMGSKCVENFPPSSYDGGIPLDVKVRENLSSHQKVQRKVHPFLLEIYLVISTCG